MRKKLSKIILGSAQFGMNYGISNKEGEIKTNEVFNILNFLKQKKLIILILLFHIKKVNIKLVNFIVNQKKIQNLYKNFSKNKKTWLINLIEQFLCLGILHIVY